MAQTDIFVFGTMMDAEVREVVLGRSLAPEHLVPASLAGFARRRLPDESYPVLVPTSEASVSGLVLRDLGSTDRARLAFFESDEYALAPCRVRLTHGDELRVSYYAEAEVMPGASEPWDLAWWQANHKLRYLAMIRPYMAMYGEATVDEAEALWERLSRDVR